MSLQPGQAWGEPSEAPIDALCARNDLELAAAVSGGVRGPLTVSGGDLARTLGCHRPRPEGREWRSVPVDTIEVATEHGQRIAVAHVTLRAPGWQAWWRGPLVFVCNAEFCGPLDIAPRAHPGDGVLDICEVAPAMKLRTRIEARRRARLGTHLPHPELRTRQVEAATWSFPTPVQVVVDSERWTRAQEISVRVRPADFRLHL